MLDAGRAVSLIIVGLLLIIAGAWFYKVVYIKYQPPGWNGSVECYGHIYGVPPGYKGAKGEGSIYYIFQNGTVTSRNFTWEVHILNDPCKSNGAARVVLSIQPSGIVRSGTIPVDRLNRTLLGPLDVTSIWGRPSAAVYGLGPTMALQISLPPRVVPGLTPQTYYYDFSTYYYNHDGMLVRVDSQRILVAGNSPNAPQYMRVIARVTDFYSASGPSGEFVSYSRSTDIVTIASIVSGLYIVSGLLLIVMGSAKFFS